MSPDVHGFFDEATNTITYVVADPQGSSCAVIDSVLDFDYASGRTDTRAADAVIALIRARGLKLEWVLETLVHADHLSAAPYLQQALGGRLGIGAQITVVQDTFGKVFNEGTRFARDGSQFDRLFKDGDGFMIGQMGCEVMHTPGHTPACLTYVIGDAAFVGDMLFMPDFGMALLYPNLSAAVADITPPGWRGSAIGIYRFWRDLGYAVGALGFGVVAHVSGSADAAFAFVAVAMGLSGAALWLWSEETHPRLNPEQDAG